MLPPILVPCVLVKVGQNAGKKSLLLMALTIIAGNPPESHRKLTGNSSVRRRLRFPRDSFDSNHNILVYRESESWRVRESQYIPSCKSRHPGSWGCTNPVIHIFYLIFRPKTIYRKAHFAQRSFFSEIITTVTSAVLK